MSLSDLRLTQRFRDFIASEVASGRYADESEVLNTALRLLEQETRESEEKLERLRRMAAEGFSQLDQGQGDVIEGEDELRDYIAAVGRRVADKSRIAESA